MFISFEGIDGSGKSTQLVMLREVLEQRGMSIITLREPGATVLSEAIREVLLSAKQSIRPRPELLLFSAARAQLVEQIVEPALEQGAIVLCDRYADSTTAYQGYGRGIDLADIEMCNTFSTRGVMPTLTFFIDVGYEEAQQRMNFHSGGAEPDRMEKSGPEFFERVRQGYLAIAKAESSRFKVIDGQNDRSLVHKEIMAYVDKIFGV